MAFEFKWKWGRVQAGHYARPNYGIIEKGSCTSCWWWTVLGPYAQCGRAGSLADAKRAAEIAYRAGSTTRFLNWTDEDDKTEAEEEALLALGDQADVWVRIVIAEQDWPCPHCDKTVKQGTRCAWVSAGTYHKECAAEKLRARKAS